MLMQVIDLLVEKEELEKKYGNLSSFDYPKEYNRMYEVNKITVQLLTDTFSEVFEGNQVIINNLLSVLKDIAFEIAYGNIKRENLSITLFTQEEFIEQYIKERFQHEETIEMFDSLFQHMPTEIKASWLMGNYLTENNNMYCDKLVNFIIMIEE